MTTTPRPTLAYARDDSRRLRKWAWRVFVVVWVALTLYLAYDRWWTLAGLRVNYWRKQGPCMRFREPADRIVFESDSDRMAALLGAPGYRGGSELTFFNDASPPPIRIAVSSRASDALAPLSAARHQVNLREAQLALEKSDAGSLIYRPTFLDDMFVVFMHRRKPTGAAARLVIIYANWRMGRPVSEYDEKMPEATRPMRRDFVTFGATVIPTGLFADVHPLIEPKPVSGVRLLGVQRAGSASHSPARWLRLQAGQPDPQDDARFTIEYETEAGRGTIGGELRADDAVQMTVRSGPCVQQPPAPDQ